MKRSKLIKVGITSMFLSACTSSLVEQLSENMNGQLLPVLRTYETEDLFSETVIYRTLGADLAIFLAHVGLTPRGTVGIDYAIADNFDVSGENLQKLFETA